MTIPAFQKKIYAHYHAHKRVLPWRKTVDPYKILVSEVMLQQTQVSRVREKYTVFIKAFPTVHSLAQAKTHEVLVLWQGLGYNRRALALKTACEKIVSDYKGKFPRKYRELLTLPGVGPYTASALMSFAYNKPSVMIETNIRSVFIHFFFPTSKKVPDTKLIPLIEKYADNSHPKDWYNALMDYGAMLKETVPNPSRKSKSHTKQSAFEGSVRQVRGAIIRLYTENPSVTKRTIMRILPYTKEVIQQQYDKLASENFFV